MDLKKLSKLKWNIEHYDGCPAFTEMTGSGFTHRLYGSEIPVYKMNACFYSDHEGDWMSLSSDHERIGRAIVGLFMKDKNIIISLQKKWLENFNLMMNNYYQWYSDDLTRLSDDELIKWADAIHNFYRKISMPGFIDGYMFYADKRFYSLVKKFCEKKKIKNYQKIFSILSAPIEPSFINEEENELRKIISKNLKKERLRIVLNLHLLRYSWIKSSYAGYKEYSKEDADKEIVKLRKERPVNRLEKNKREKEKLLKKYKFSKEIKAIVKLTEIFVNWQDQRKIYTLTFVSLQSKILMEISMRAKINYDLLKYTQTRELEPILRKKFNVLELKKRVKASFFLYENKKGKFISIVTGKDAIDFLKKVSEEKFGDVEELIGMTASLGRVRGKVKIITSAKYINKVEKGNILVAPMTRPEHLAGMKKAAAIVTDDGGITCHAAIVARELRIPCIIGTKIATKILKDGDLVEVDAYKGIVKILKKAA